MEKSYQYGLRLLPVGCLALILLIMNSTDPTKSVTSILLVFLLLYIMFTSIIYSLLRHYWSRMKQESHRVLASKRRSYYIASAVGILPVIIIAMQSLQQVRLFDILLVLVLLGLVLFYIVKRTS